MAIAFTENLRRTTVTGIVGLGSMFGGPSFSQPGLGGDEVKRLLVNYPETYYLKVGASLSNYSTTTQIIPMGCYLTAIVEGEATSFTTAQEKFNALVDSWDECNIGRSVINYHDFAMLQIIGMGSDAVPFLLERLKDGASELVYPLKCITGQEADTPDMLGDEDRVIDAWIEWGKHDGKISG